MTHTKLVFGLLAAAIAACAQAQVDPGLGGHIDTFATATTENQRNDRPSAIIYNSDPGKTRYYDSIYGGTPANAVISWVPNPNAPASAGNVFQIVASKPSGLPDDTIARGEVSPRWDYTISGVRWYAFSIYIPNGWILNDSEMNIAQLHTSQKTAVVSPPVRLSIQGKYLQLGLEASELSDDTTVTPHIEKATSSSQLIKLAAIDKPEARDKWYCFVMRADWSPNPGSGTFALWMNNKLVYQASNAFNAYRTWLGNYAKTGLYVPGSAAMPATQTIYTDYIYLAGPATTDPADLARLTQCGAP